MSRAEMAQKIDGLVIPKLDVHDSGLNDIDLCQCFKRLENESKICLICEGLQSLIPPQLDEDGTKGRGKLEGSLHIPKCVIFSRILIVQMFRLEEQEICLFPRQLCQVSKGRIDELAFKPR